jgi:TPR repeat protein
MAGKSSWRRLFIAAFSSLAVAAAATLPPALAQPAPNGIAECKDDNAQDCERQCRSGSGASCRRLARMYFFGSTVAQNATKGMGYAARGCELGEGGSCTLAAGGYCIGKGVPVDARRAIQFADKGCAANDAKACQLAASIRARPGDCQQQTEPATSQTTPQPAAQAPQPWVAACGRGAHLWLDSQGMPSQPETLLAPMASCITKLRGLAPDIADKVAGCFLQVSTLHCADPIGGVAMFTSPLPATGSPPPVATNGATAQATAPGNAPSGAEADLKRVQALCSSINACQSACSAGDLSACAQLGSRYLAGQGVTKNYTKGFALLMDAYSQDQHLQAQNNSASSSWGVSNMTVAHASLESVADHADEYCQPPNGDPQLCVAGCSAGVATMCGVACDKGNQQTCLDRCAYWLMADHSMDGPPPDPDPCATWQHQRHVVAARMVQLGLKSLNTDCARYKRTGDRSWLQASFNLAHAADTNLSPSDRAKIQLALEACLK